VIAVAGLDDLLAFVGESAELSVHRERLLAYRARYGCREPNDSSPAGGMAP
jgi:orotate phosphoribosyltransferase